MEVTRARSGLVIWEVFQPVPECGYKTYNVKDQNYWGNGQVFVAVSSASIFWIHATPGWLIPPVKGCMAGLSNPFLWERIVSPAVKVAVVNPCCICLGSVAETSGAKSRIVRTDSASLKSRTLTFWSSFPFCSKDYFGGGDIRDFLHLNTCNPDPSSCNIKDLKSLSGLLKCKWPLEGNRLVDFSGPLGYHLVVMWIFAA